MVRYGLREKYGFIRSRVAIILEELKSKSNLGLYKRLELLYKGFFSESYFLYNLNYNDIDLYLSDYHRRKTRFINGDNSYILNNKIVFDNMISKYVKTPQILLLILKGNIITVESENPIGTQVDMGLLKKRKINICANIDAGGGRNIRSRTKWIQYITKSNNITKMNKKPIAR